MEKRTKLLTAIFAAVFAFSLAVSCGNPANGGSSGNLSAKESLSESTEESLPSSGNETESVSESTENSEYNSTEEPEKEHIPSKFEEKKIKTSRAELHFVYARRRNGKHAAYRIPSRRQRKRQRSFPFVFGRRISAVCERRKTRKYRSLRDHAATAER